MLEAIVFGITLGITQTLVGLAITRFIMSKKFIKMYYNWIIGFSEELNNMEFGKKEEES